ncbi:LuxR family transcriptional regulator [Candidatus Magnetomorum sp. HK-1]|nr:LuxR family transcriptional regulator [Candidatus Magnetomorum sp. HK-1]
MKVFPLPQLDNENFDTFPKELYSLWRIPFNNDMEPFELVAALRERIKELNCLYAIGQLSERHSDSIKDLLQEIVNFLPFSWQYPEITCARIIFKDVEYKSKGFKITKWRQSSRLFMYNEPVGEITILYLEERPPADEGPFLKEERALLDALALRIGSAAVRIFAEIDLKEINNQLLTERKALQEANLALRNVLARIEEEKQTIYNDIQANVDKIIIPILHELSLHLPKNQRKYADLLRTNLEDITSTFVSQLSKNFLSLTSTELSICNMIRSGLQTKEIAQIRGVSVGTINRHREHIRRKLKITNSDINLATYLQCSTN